MVSFRSNGWDWQLDADLKTQANRMLPDSITDKSVTSQTVTITRPNGASTGPATNGMSSAFLSPLRRRIPLFVPRQFLALAILTLVFFQILSVLRDYAGNTVPNILFSQDWTNQALISRDAIRSGLPEIIGYCSLDLTTTSGTNLQLILAYSTRIPMHVLVIQACPNPLTSGVAEIPIENPVIARRDSGTADEPFIVLHGRAIRITLDRNGYVVSQLNNVPYDTNQPPAHDRGQRSLTAAYLTLKT